MTGGVDAVVQQLEDGSRNFFGVDGIRVELGQREERPFSEVWRATVSGPPAPLAIYIKLIRLVRAGGPSPDGLRARVQKEFETCTRLHRAMRGDSHLSTVRPIACFASPLAMVTEEVPGITFLQLLERRARRFRPLRSFAPDSVFEHVGLWVRRFQEIEGVMPSRSFDELIEYVDIRMRRLVLNTRASFDEDARRRTLEYLNCRRADIGPEDLADVAVHGDLTPANAMTDGTHVAVLDFPMIKRGTRLHDLARFHAQMDLFKAKPQIDPKVITQLQAALLRGYDPTLTADRAAFEVLLLLHTINHFESLVTRPARFPINLYNARVAARHRKWIHRIVAARASRPADQ